MPDFENSRWANGRFAQEYRDQADGYIPERRSLIAITQSLYKHLVRGNAPRRILDLGCGDGLMVQELLKVDPNIDATLVDGSKEMLIPAIKDVIKQVDLKHQKMVITPLAGLFD